MKANHFILQSLLIPLCVSVAGSVSDAATIDLNRSIADNGLVPTGIHWGFDGNANDSSGNGSHGTLVAGGGLAPTFENGKFGQAVRLNPNGTMGQTSQINPNVTRAGSASSTALDFVGTSFSGGAWLKLDTVRTGAAHFVYIMERGRSVYAPDAGDFFTFMLHKTTADTWTVRLFLGNASQGAPKQLISSTTRAFNDLDWHHVAFSYEYNATGDNMVTFFLDGLELGDSVATEINLPELGSSTVRRTFTVGERNQASYASDYSGLIDDVFLTTGLYTYVAPVPEPSSMAFLGFGAIAGFLAYRGRKGTSR